MDLIRLICRLGLALLALASNPAAAARGDAPGAGAASLRPVILQLNAPHSLRFVGFYTAQQQGFYKAAGLDVDIRPGAVELDTPRQVLDGQADFGVGDNSLLLRHLQGEPLLILAALLQHSPRVLLTRQDPPGHALGRTLTGKRIMIAANDSEMLKYLRLSGLNLDAIQQLPPSSDPQDLLEGRTDAMVINMLEAPYRQALGNPQLRIRNPRSIGLDFYGDTLFTRSSLAEREPELTADFRRATLLGWRYAMAHIAESIELIQRDFAPQLSTDVLLQQTRILQALMQPEVIEIGYLNPERWAYMARINQELGLVPTGTPVDTGQLLYQESPLHLNLTWVYVGFLLTLVSYGIAFYTLHINRRLDAALRNSQQVQEALTRSELRHRLLAENASDIIWTMDLDGHYTYVSPAVRKMLGYEVDEFMQRSLEHTMPPASAHDLRNSLEDMLKALREKREIPDQRKELDYRHQQSHIVHTEVTLSEMRDDQGEFCGVLGVVRDISARWEAEERLRRMAQQDALTGLPNRALFRDRVTQSLRNRRREGGRLALCFLDLDNFKPVNDTYGHDMGDLLLQEVARRMTHCIRESDTLARIGGDEFVVLLNNIFDAEAACLVAEKLRLALSRPILLRGIRLNISSSIGIAISPEHGVEYLELCQHADRAMYQAKHAGRNQIRLYSHEG